MTPLWVRVWHWAIAIVFVILVLTGVVLTYSSAGFALMDYALADTLHQVTGILMAVLYGVFLVAAWATGYWHRYLGRSHGLWPRIRLHGSYVVAGGTGTAVADWSGPTRLDLSRGFLFLFQQLLSIFSLVLLTPLLILTGLVLYFPELLPGEVAGLAGLWPFSLAHYWAGLFGALFLIFHVYIATIGGLRRMIKGR